jgi:hypothetical protein
MNSGKIKKDDIKNEMLEDFTAAYGYLGVTYGYP